MFDFLFAKPVLIGLHLVFAIIGIDASLWLLGEFIAKSGTVTRRAVAALLALFGFLGSWIIGGYYYLTYYGSLVKPIIKSGSAPWAHAIAMEAKEHVFLFLIPMAITMVVVAYSDTQWLDASKLRKPILWLLGTIVAISLYIGILGYVISAAVRWA